ncbi:MAG: nucleotidyltransferase domain-containing protein [Dissulfurispiraceae bacterium]
MVMTTPLKKAVNTIVRVAKPDKIILFGSHAGVGRKKESDYDLLVLKKNLKDQRKLTQKIYLNFGSIGAPVDVLTLDSGRFEELKNDPYFIYSEIHEHGKIVYEKYVKSKRLAKKGKK